MHHVNMLSGGLGSWATGKLIVREHGSDNLTHLFTDTNYEDADLYRFLPQAVANIGGTLVQLSDGRDPWQVFHDERRLGSNQVAPCSRILKQKLARDWVETNYAPQDVTLYVGIFWYERHRMESTKDRIGIRDRYLPYRVEAPLIATQLDRYEVKAWLDREGIDLPRMYDEGFVSNNCGGRCVRQGQAGWANLLRKRPESFRECEEKEQEMRAFLGKDVAILRDRRHGKTKPLPLVELRRRIEAGEGCELLDYGTGCECFFGDENLLDTDSRER